MDLKQWTNNINNLGISPSLKTLIISFFKEFSNNLSFLMIKNEDLKRALTNINNYKPLLICIDIEFQNALESNYDYQTRPGLTIFKDPYTIYIRECGILFFIKEADNWYYIGNVFINFPPLTTYGIKRLI